LSNADISGEKAATAEAAALYSQIGTVSSTAPMSRLQLHEARVSFLTGEQR
jgi:hypothetical protein